MHYSQKYALVAFFEPIDINTEFSMADWPLHITLVDVFSIDSKNIEDKLTKLFAEERRVTVAASADSALGTASVVLIKKSDELLGLHERIIDLLELNGVIFNHPEYTGAGFLPHSTIQGTGRLFEGDMRNISMVSLVDFFPDGRWTQRKVLRNFKLKLA